MNMVAKILFSVLGLTVRAADWASGQENIHQGTERKLVALSDGQGQLVFRLNYDGRCILDQVIVCGCEVASDSGVCTGIHIDGQWFSLLEMLLRLALL
jgi:hypothetical protein